MAGVTARDEKTPAAPVAAASKKKRRGIFLLVLIIIVVSVLLAGAYFINKANKKNQPVLVIGTTEISKQQYDDLINQAAKAKVSKNDATNTIIDIEKKKIAAKQLNVAVSDNDIAYAAAQKYEVYEAKDLNDWQKLNGVGVAIDNALLLTSKDNHDGTVYYFPFSRLFAQTIPPSTDPKFGDRTAIAEDKAYASAQAKSYRDKLTNGSLSSKNALTQIQADKRLDYGFAANDSNDFSVDSTGKTYLDGQSASQQLDTKVVKTINSLKAGETSGIDTIQAGITLSPIPEYKGQTVDVAYYFVQLDKKNQANSDIQKQFDAAIKTIKVTKHV